jgi:hypothetical protein
MKVYNASWVTDPNYRNLAYEEPSAAIVRIC